MKLLSMAVGLVVLTALVSCAELRHFAPLELQEPKTEPLAVHIQPPEEPRSPCRGWCTTCEPLPGDVIGSLSRDGSGCLIFWDANRPNGIRERPPTCGNNLHGCPALTAPESGRK